MPSRLKHATHLVPLVAVLVIGIAAFFALRSAAVPAGFGRFGHYRPGALNDIRARPVTFAGQTACAACHEDVVNVRSGGKHARVSCEACHGPLAAHADDPSAAKPKQLAGTRVCQRCHESDSAKPAAFPQVASAEHSGGAECWSCHQPHSPKL